MRRMVKSLIGDGNAEESAIGGERRKTTIARMLGPERDTLMTKVEVLKTKGLDLPPLLTPGVQPTEAVVTEISTESESGTRKVIESTNLLHISTALATVTAMIDPEVGIGIASIDTAIAAEVPKTLKTDPRKPTGPSRLLQSKQKMPLGDLQLPMAQSKSKVRAPAASQL